MKSPYVLLVLATVAGVMLSCNRSPNPNEIVARLPELPAQFADNLTTTKIDNVLMTKSPPPVHNAPKVNPLRPKQRSCIKKYAAYVVYPMTVCFPPDILVTGEITAIEARVDPSGWSPAPPSANYYKLSKSTVARFANPLFCRISGGPWYAEVTTIESCDDSVPEESTLDIIAAPQPFSVHWDGGIADVPPPFNPSWFGFAGESCSCCSTFTQCPDGRCVPHGVNCSISPAVNDHVLPK